jgi:hypothetical protein
LVFIEGLFGFGVHFLDVVFHGSSQTSLVDELVESLNRIASRTVYGAERHPIDT